MSDEKKKTMKRVSIMYMCVAMAICVALAVAIAAVSSLSLGEISVPEISLAPDVSTEGTASDVQTGGDTSNVDAVVRTKYVYPVSGGSIQKAYSIDKLVFSQSMNDWRTHGGVDLKGEIGTDVLSYADGTISKIYTDVLMGQTVEIEHSDGLISVYRNLDETLYDNIKEGQFLFAGEKIGRIGATAGAEVADGPHLHFEIIKQGKNVDPAGYLGIAENLPTADPDQAQAQQ